MHTLAYDQFRLIYYYAFLFNVLIYSWTNPRLPLSSTSRLHKTKNLVSFQTFVFPFPGSPISPFCTPLLVWIHLSLQKSLRLTTCSRKKVFPIPNVQEIEGLNCWPWIRNLCAVCPVSPKQPACVVCLYGKGKPKVIFSHGEEVFQQ